MIWNLRIEPVAQRETRVALAFYSTRDPKLADRFTRKLEKTLEAIHANPHRWAEVEDDIREAIVDGWPFAIYYRLDTDWISVFAIFNTSRDPQEWMNRI